jgi:hypothetical protein
MVRATARSRLPAAALYLLALAGLATGAALLVFFLAGVSLPVAVAAVALVVGAASAFVWRQLDHAARRIVRRRAIVGLCAGAVATIAYDLTRAGLVATFHLPVRPFEAVPLFGQLLLGTSSPSIAGTLVGVAYHLANGSGFGLAFAMVAGERGPLAGVMWGLVLEAVMLTFYPGWLDIRAIQEFASVSALGHVAYGATLGWTTRRWLPRGQAPPGERSR